MNAKSKSTRHWQTLCLSASLISIAFVTIAESRPWKPTDSMLAQDYANIVDQRGKGDLVMLMWMVPESLPEQQAVAREILSRYVVLGAVHAHVDATGTFSFDDIDSLQISDSNGRALVALDNTSMPPAISGTLVTMQAILGQAAGPFGKGIHWFAYKGDGVSSCKKGVLSIQFAGEKYTYETPIPGCPKS